MKTTALRERVNLVIALTVRSPLRVEVARSLCEAGRQGGGQARGEVPEAQRAGARTQGQELLPLGAQSASPSGPPLLAASSRCVLPSSVLSSGGPWAEVGGNSHERHHGMSPCVRHRAEPSPHLPFACDETHHPWAHEGASPAQRPSARGGPRAAEPGAWGSSPLRRLPTGRPWAADFPASLPLQRAQPWGFSSAAILRVT